MLTTGDKEKLLDEIDEIEARFGLAPLRNFTDRLTPEEVDVVAVGSLVQNASGGVVLVRRLETPDEWLIPGGTVDSGESVVDAAVREVHEETGLRTNVDGLLRVGLARNYGPPEFRAVNQSRFGKEEINLLFVNFHATAEVGALDASQDPVKNILEVRAFTDIPFDDITHVYRVLFVYSKLVPGALGDYPPVQFSPSDQV